MPAESDSHPSEREIFLDASEIEDAEARAAFLDKACDGDAHLRMRVEKLLGIEEFPDLIEPESWVRPMIDEVKSNPEKVSTKSRTAWEPPAAADIDPLFDAYDVEELVGRGGMGAVYRGRQTSLERPVAIKILPPEFGNDPSFAERFRREALAMGNLEHPNIVTIHEFGSAGDYFFIAMEFVEGADLHQLISAGKLTPEAALGVVSQICDALQYAHGQGYVHRDIKPANIFVNADGRVKVGDFGLAKLAEDDKSESQLTMTGYQIGTPDYMAPETRSGGEIDHRADIYSLGVMFYEMLTGSVPKGVFAPPSKKVEVDVRIDEVVLKALQEVPELRYQQASEVRTEVEAISGEAIRPRTRLSTRRWLKLSVGIAAAIGAITTGFKVAPLLEPDKTIIVVTTAKDENDGIKNGRVSLREAIEHNVPGEGAVIRFSPKVFTGGAANVIALEHGQILISRDVVIDASALTDGVTIDALERSRAMEIEKGSQVTFDMLRIVNAKVEELGGGILIRNSDSRPSIVTLRRCVLRNNAATIGGGGIYSFAAPLILENCIFEGNRAFYGGAIHSDRQMIASHCTIVDNYGGMTSTGGGGGIFGKAGTVEVYNCIVARNRGYNGPDIRAGDDTEVTFAGVNIVRSLLASKRVGPVPRCVDPRLGQLEIHGGSVLAIPRKDSPAIDAAPAGNEFTTDFRGVDRSIDGNLDGLAVWDLGAVEFDPASDTLLESESTPIVIVDDLLPLKRDLPGPANLPRGKVCVWGKTDNHQMAIANASGFDDFVEVQLNRRNGWYGLRSNGDIVSWEGGADGVEIRKGAGVRSLNRLGGAFHSAWLTDGGGITSRGENDLQLEAPDGGVVDLARTYPTGRIAMLSPQGQIIEETKLPGVTPPPQTDFVRIGNFQDRFFGLRENGEILIWGEGEDPRIDLDGNRIVREHSTALFTILLTEDSQIFVISKGGVWHMPRPEDGSRWIDVTCGNYVFAARRSTDNRWFAWGGNDAGIIGKVNSLGPNVLSLSIDYHSMVWVEGET